MWPRAHQKVKACSHRRQNATAPAGPCSHSHDSAAAQVGVLDLEAGERARLVGQALRDVQALGQVGVVRRVRLPRRRFVAARLQLLQRVLADGLQHGDARVAGRRFGGLHQAPVDQGRHGGERVRHAVGGADRLRRVEGRTAGEDAEPAEDDLLLGVRRSWLQAMASRIVR